MFDRGPSAFDTGIKSTRPPAALAMMFVGMRPSFHEHEVLNTVVGSIVVDVVYMLCAQHPPAKFLLHQEPVFVDSASSCNVYNQITADVRARSCHPMRTLAGM